MLEALLKKLGYIHESKLTDTVLETMLCEKIGDVFDYKLDPKVEKGIFADVSKVDFIMEYLRATMAKDIQRYFAAPDEKQRDIIRGAFARTVYLKSRISKRGEVDTKIDGLRYE